MIRPLLQFTAAHARALRAAVRSRSDDTGASSLETVVIALGLLALAAAVVAAITVAVNSRIAQIN